MIDPYKIHVEHEKHAAGREAARRKWKVGLTHGVFDLLHAGQMEHLRQCSFLCERLIVSVVADRFVTKAFIVNDERTRVFQVSMVKGVDEVILCEDLGPSGLLSRIKPDVYIRKDEYDHQARPEYAVARELGMDCAFTNTVPPHARELIQRIWDLKARYDKR